MVTKRMLEQPLKGNQKLKMGKLKTSDESPSESQQNNVKTPTENNNKFTQKSYKKQSQKNLQRILPGTHKYYPKNCTKFPVETYQQPSTSTTKHTNKQTPKQTNTNTLTIIQQHTNSQLTTHKPTVIHKNGEGHQKFI